MLTIKFIMMSLLTDATDELLNGAVVECIREFEKKEGSFLVHDVVPLSFSRLIQFLTVILIYS